MKSKTLAFNPYLPGYEYIPDAEPYVFNGRIYIYGSHDESEGTKYCSGDYVCWSASVNNPGEWQYEGVIYRKIQDPVNPDGSHTMFAPDVAKGPDGRYYLYYGIDFSRKISVAVCDKPAGKFEFYGMVHYENSNNNKKDFTDFLPFDPAVLVDDDGGRIYLYYGFCPHFQIPWVDKDEFKGGMVVEIEQDMITVKSPPKVVLPYFADAEGTGFEDHAFFEASSIRKIKGKYYLVYSSQQMHELCYAISTYPDKGFTYGGVIISNGDIGYKGRKPEDRLAYTGNNHGGLVEINNQWYIFYHRSTQATQFSRQGCAEPVFISDNGSIEQVEMTSCGLNGGPLPAEGTYSAHIACNLLGPRGAFQIGHRPGLKASEPYIFEEVCGMKEEERNQFIANITSGTKIGFKYFSFDKQVKTIILNLRGKATGTIRIHIDGFDKTLIGERNLYVDTDQWSDYEVRVSTVNETHGIFIDYSGDGCLEFNGFTFET